MEGKNDKSDHKSEQYDIFLRVLSEKITKAEGAQKWLNEEEMYCEEETEYNRALVEEGRAAWYLLNCGIKAGEAAGKLRDRLYGPA